MAEIIAITVGTQGPAGTAVSLANTSTTEVLYNLAGVVEGSSGLTWTTAAGGTLNATNATIAGTLAAATGNFTTVSGAHTGTGAGLTALDASGITTGTLALARGGTGSGTAAGARTNLDVPGLNTANTFVGAQAVTGTLAVSSTLSAAATTLASLSVTGTATANALNVTSGATANSFTPSSTAGYFSAPASSSYALWDGGSPNTFLRAAAAAHVPLVARGFTSQSANLTEWQNSGGTVLASVSAAGNLTLAGTATIGSTRPVVASGAAGTLTIQGDAGSWATGFYALGSAATNRGGFGFLGSADALSYYFVGSAYNAASLYVLPGNLVGVNTSSPSGQLHVHSPTNDVRLYLTNTGGAATSAFHELDGSGNLYVWNGNNASTYLVTNGTTRVQISGGGSIVNFLGGTGETYIIRGAASHATSLQQWQNSAGTVLAAVDQGGKLAIGTGTASYPITVVGTSGSGAYIGVSTSAMANNDIAFYCAFTGSVAHTLYPLYTQANTTGTAYAVLSNIDNTAGHAAVAISTGGASGGDPKLILSVPSVTDWSIGADNSDSDNLKIGTSASVGTSTQLTLTTAGILTAAGQGRFASIGVGNSAAATTPGTVTKKIQVFDNAGASLGYVAVYDAIT